MGKRKKHTVYSDRWLMEKRLSRRSELARENLFDAE